MKNEDEVIADIIDDGADYIEKNGWFRGDLYQKGTGSEHPPACMMGGLVAADKDESTGHNRVGLWLVVARIWKVIPELTGRSLAAWNDNEAQDKQEVLDLMRLASKRIRGSHE